MSGFVGDTKDLNVASPVTTEQRILFLRKGLGVRRYHQRYTSVIDSVGKHSAGVAGFLLLLYEHRLPPARVLAQAIVHDLPECVTGDIPSPAKRAMGQQAKEELERKETELLEQHGFNYGLSEEEERRLKLADCLDGLMFCVEELQRGNREVETVGHVYASYVLEIACHSNPIEMSVVHSVYKLWENAQ